MLISDGNRTAKIVMQYWTGDGYTPDWSMDFFEAGSLPMNEDRTAHMVQDVDYCIEQANDWAAYRGDCGDHEAEEVDTARGYERCVDVAWEG